MCGRWRFIRDIDAKVFSQWLEPTIKPLGNKPELPFSVTPIEFTEDKSSFLPSGQFDLPAYQLRSTTFNQDRKIIQSRDGVAAVTGHRKSDFLYL